LLVNNAGFGTRGWFAETSRERVDEEVRLNVCALTHLTHAVLGPMVSAGRGRGRDGSSGGFVQTRAQVRGLAAAKAALTRLREALHVERRRSGVTVTALCPGLTATEFQDVSGGEPVGQSMPLAWLDVDDVAATGLADCAKGKALSVPGPQYKAVTTLSGIAP